MNANVRRAGSCVAALGLTLLACASGCSRPQPVRPHLLIVTVDGLPADGLGAVDYLRQLAGQCVRFEGIEAPGVTAFDALAALHAGLAPDAPQLGNADPLAPPGGPGAPLPGAVDTVMERIGPLGFETAAVVSAADLGVDSGLLQGAAHVWDRPMLEAQEAAAPLATAVNTAAAFLDARLVRRVEHGAVLWLHLDLGELPEAERGVFLDSALARLSAALEADPRHVLAIWFLPSADAFDRRAPFWIRVPGEPARGIDTDVEAVDLAPTLLARLGAPTPLPATPPFAPLAGRDLLAPTSP